MFAGPVEVDETYVGGIEANKKLHAGRGGVGKAVVVGARDRATGKVKAEGRARHESRNPARLRTGTT